jgi:hypothetical protein
LTKEDKTTPFTPARKSSNVWEKHAKHGACAEQHVDPEAELFAPLLIGQLCDASEFISAQQWILC